MAASHHPEISATEIELKRRGRRRLIGAITIGLLAVVFLPMIFDSEPKRSSQAMKAQDISVHMPSKEGQTALPAPSSAPVVVTPSPPATPIAATPTASDVSMQEAVAETGKPATAPAASPTKDATKETVKSAAKGAKNSKVETAPPIDKTGFVVQLGVFSDAENTRQVIAKMKEAKLGVYTENIAVKSGNATRVRVGPFASRDKADAALAQVKLAGADGKIVSLK